MRFFAPISVLRRGGARALAAAALAVALSLPGQHRFGSIAPAATVAEAAQGNQGLSGGWAVDDKGNIAFYHSLATQYGIMRDAGAGWVRINFRLGACFKDWTSRGCNGRTALQVYADLVGQAKSNNLQVLGVLSNETWKGSPSQWVANNAENNPSASGDNAYVRTFADKAAGVLATQFNGTNGPLITDWEVWNEPNAWTAIDAKGNPAGGTFIYPSNFAWLLKRSYTAIRASNANPTSNVISGGIFSHDPGGATVSVTQEGGSVTRVTKRGDLVGAARRPRQPATPERPGDAAANGTTAALASSCLTSVPSGADYLCSTYDMGLSKAGWIRGAFPLTHVGQHIYVDQGNLTSAAKLTTHLQEVRGAYVAYEGTSTAKKTFVTEFGWETRQGSAVTADVAADNLRIAYDTFKPSSTPYVGRAFWFSVQDVPEGDVYFGLVDGGGQDKCATVNALTKCTEATYKVVATY